MTKLFLAVTIALSLGLPAMAQAESACVKACTCEYKYAYAQCLNQKLTCCRIEGKGKCGCPPNTCRRVCDYDKAKKLCGYPACPASKKKVCDNQNAACIKPHLAALNACKKACN